MHENIPRAQGSVMTRRRKTAEVKAGTVSDSLGVDPEVISRLKAPGGLNLSPLPHMARHELADSGEYNQAQLGPSTSECRGRRSVRWP